MADLTPDDYFMYCLKVDIPANLPRPPQPLVNDVEVTYDPSGGVVDADLKYRFGDDGNPTNDTDPMGGTMDDTVDVDPDVSGNLISTLTILGTDQDYRGIAGRQNKHATGEFQNAKVSLRTGAILPAGSGAIVCYSTSSSDTDPVNLIYKTSSAFTQEDLELNGTTPVNSLDTCDAGSHIVATYNNGAIPVGNIYGVVDGEVVFVIFGSNSSAGNYMAHTLGRIALASSLNADLSAADRKTDPTGIGTYARSVYWPELDTRQDVPT